MAQAKRPTTGRDMVLSLVVILVPLAIIVAIFGQGPRDAEVETVDWKPVAIRAGQQAPYQVLAPVELPAGWRATRVSWTRVGQPDPTGSDSVRNRWQLGVLTDSDLYIELDQGDIRAKEMVDDLSRQGAPDGTSTVDGRTWKRLVTDDDRTRSLVLATPRVTAIVAGDVSYSLLETYVGLLQPQKS
ncbi:DUF4245 domain-containing protein [Microlunatus sp. Gsoil 973]|uniref:DUF4245 domain-containing protein n=1 Tax=Microlunatus sp. Gsoil 973 TaxID=2672569 RepID=UPI0018A83DB7|nr:DUF4245 domain-containing protein [Microlunatus sp. Gsoil 973]